MVQKIEFDMDNPSTWSQDDPFLWMHRQWYGRRFNEPTNFPETSTVSESDSTGSHPAEDTNSDAVEQQTYRVAGLDVTNEELLNTMKDTNKGAHQVHLLQKYGDPQGDFERDWYKDLEPFLTPEDEGEEDFLLWNAKQHFRMDKKAEKRMAEEAKNANAIDSKVKTSSIPTPSLSTSLRSEPKKNKPKVAVKQKIATGPLKTIQEMKESVVELRKNAVRLRGELLKINKDGFTNQEIEKNMKELSKELRYLSSVKIGRW